MMLFKWPIGKPDSETLRDIAEAAGVEWDYQTIRDIGPGRGYADAPDDADPKPIQDAAEPLLGLRPAQYDAPEQDTSEAD